MSGALLFSHAASLLTLAGPDRARRGPEMSDLGLVRDGSVLISHGKILRAGPHDQVTRKMSESLAPLNIPPGQKIEGIEDIDDIEDIEEIDCRGCLLAPGLVDSHTHLVFGTPRYDDYQRRLRGETYEQIAAAGGGIQTSLGSVRAAALQRLTHDATDWALRARACGTTTLEAKTGYALNLEGELKCLAAARAVAEITRQDIPRTFLGAHIVPPEYRADRDAYIRLLLADILPAAALDGAAEFGDVFCDPAGFSVAESRLILTALRRHGLKIKLHVEQFDRIGGLELGLEFNPVSLDHLDAVDEAGARLLAASPAVATLLPGSNFFLGRPAPPARLLLDCGAAVSLATDFNPGTCPIISLPLIMALACSGMRMSPAEAWTAVTINAAAALDRAPHCGSLQPGKRADLARFELDDYRAIPYFAGANLCNGVCLRGAWFPVTSPITSPISPPPVL